VAACTCTICSIELKAAQTLLSPEESNPKIKKGNKYPFLSAILHLSPADRSGFNTCPYASPGCKAACLNTSGHGQFDSTQRARIRKTHFLFNQTEEFMARLSKEIEAHIRKAGREGKGPALRLNGTSDISWSQYRVERGGEEFKNVFEAFPEVFFYDYTKVPSRLTSNPYSNYHLTFSLSENNDRTAVKVIEQGFNVAAVLDVDLKEEFPATWGGFPLLDGTLHDLRFLDPKEGGHIVGLKPKGKAKGEETGFLRSPYAGFDLSRIPLLAVNCK
jgi:hypothetical protein